jgi:polar amino acid transport system substrate-binding protein
MNRTSIFPLGICLALLAAAPRAAPAAGLPDDIQKRGTLNVAVVPNYPPLEFRDPDSNALSGFDIELGDALAARMGIKMAWQETPFEQMIASVTTGRVDIILSGMTDLATRHPTTSFVDYMQTGPQFFVQKSRAGEFPDMLAMCGKQVGASRRTSLPKEIETWSAAHCEPAGKPAIRVVGTEGSADARTQLKQGRIDAAVQGSETLPYIMAQEPGTFTTIGARFATQLNGIGVAPANTPVQQALADALTAIIADGTYAKLLAKWQLASNAIDKVSINAGQ